MFTQQTFAENFHASDLVPGARDKEATNRNLCLPWIYILAGHTRQDM